MEWKKAPITYRELRIVRRYADGRVSSYYAPYGDSLEPERHKPVEIDITPKDKEIHVSMHEIEHYTLILKQELPEGTLGMFIDELKIGIIDEKKVCYIQRSIIDSADFDKNPQDNICDKFLFENDKLTSYEGRPTKDYQFVGKHKVIATELAGFTNGILDNRESVTDSNLNPHYESFKKIRQDISQSLEACLNELKK